MTNLPPIGSIDRETAGEMLRQIAVVASALQNLPYRDAVAALVEVDSLQEALTERFPGGYVGDCDYCGLPLGAHEISARDDVNGGVCCPDCADEDLPTVIPQQEHEVA